MLLVQLHVLMKQSGGRDPVVTVRTLEVTLSPLSMSVHVIIEHGHLVSAVRAQSAVVPSSRLRNRGFRLIPPVLGEHAVDISNLKHNS